MRVQAVQGLLSVLAFVCLVPSVASAQKKVTCADNTIVTSKAACKHHGGVQKPGGLNKAGKEINKAAIDVKDEAKRTPGNVERAVSKRTYKAKCNDGTTWTGKSKGDACKDHGGVASWP